VGGFPGKIENRQNFTKKSFGQDIFTPAVNEKWEFAGNVQFVAVAHRLTLPYLPRRSRVSSLEMREKARDAIVLGISPATTSKPSPARCSCNNSTNELDVFFTQLQYEHPSCIMQSAAAAPLCTSQISQADIHPTSNRRTDLLSIYTR
jgi:hypothetical protein